MPEVLTSRDLLLRLFFMTPRPVSRVAYDLARRYVFRDRRQPIFDEVFASVKASGTSGDYLEFGVFRGTSFINAYNAAVRHGLEGMRFLAFDSFAGLPHDEAGVFRKGDYTSPRRVFDKMLDRTGVDMGRVRVVEGRYDEVLTDELKGQLELRRAAVVHIDCDLYSSTRDALQFVTDLVGVGTVIIFDDWHSFGSEEHGEAQAFNEWPLHSCFDVTHERVAKVRRVVTMVRAGQPPGS